MPNTRTRRLWLNIKFKVPPGTTKDTVIGTLIDSIENGTYDLPERWDVRILWRNKENAPMRAGEWKRELKRSRRSSSGFDKVVILYLENL